jgi:hypothetical protein
LAVARCRRVVAGGTAHRHHAGRRRSRNSQQYNVRAKRLIAPISAVTWLGVRAPRAIGGGGPVASPIVRVPCRSDMAHTARIAWAAALVIGAGTGFVGL